MRISELGLLKEEDTWIDGKRQSVPNAIEARKRDMYYGVSVDHDEENDMWEVVGNKSGFVYLQSFNKDEADALRKEMILSFSRERTKNDNLHDFQREQDRKIRDRAGKGLGGDEPYRDWDDW